MNNQNSPFAPIPTDVNRRRFIAGTGAAALSFTFIQPGSLLGAEATTKLNIGLIGCGGRGQWILKYFADHGGFKVAGVADYFEDRANAAGDKFQVPAGMRFTGLNGYRRLLEQKLDAVAIESPPYFHPEHAAAAVAAGKHVYVAKPIAVDVPGCQSIADSGKKATENKQVFLVDFQTRAHPAYQEAVKRVHAGAIGKVINGEATYQCPLYFEAMDAEFRKKPGTSESRLRAWAIDRVLSGDIITEQNIHALDVAAWILDAAPLKAYGTGGRARPFLGDCWDHFAVIYYYPNDVILSFCSRQFGKFWDDIQCRVYGTEGTIDTHYGGQVVVHCDDKYNGGLTQNIYADGVVHNVATFHESILKGNYANPTVAPSVRSNLTTILGRLAAYKNREVTWKDMIRANEKWTFDTKGLKA